jgi:hypothetical protein
VFLAGPALRSSQLAAVVTATLVELTNQDRAQNKLDGLTVNSLLTEAAQAKANDMAKNGYFAHTSPTGLTPWYWFKQAGYSFTYAGENLAVDFTDSDTVNQAWMNSPEHRANILNSHFTDIGIATAQGMYEGQETTFVVQEFASPADNLAAAADNVLDVITPAQPTQMAYATSKSATTSAAQVLGTSAASVNPVTAPAPAARAKPATVAALIHASSTQTAAIEESQASPKYVPVWLSFLVASPQNLLRAIYLVLGALLLIALAVRTGFEFKHHHMRHLAIVLALLVLMGALLFVADHYIFVKPIVGSAASVQSEAVL